ncbi:MAG: TVP38/TMEM64 family protein [Planctomycetota bacterium]
MLWTLLACVVGVALWQFSDTQTLESLANREVELRRWQSEQPVFVFVIAFVLYVAVTGLSLPGAAGLSLAYGWYFGLVQGVILISFASTLGATIAFLISRFLMRDTVQTRFGERLSGFNEDFARQGAYYLLTLRLIPAVPFFVINAVMGLTPIRIWTFWWVSQLGMLPGTVLYIYAGSSVPTIRVFAESGVSGILSWELFIAFTLLGLFPLLVRHLLKEPNHTGSSPTE